MLHAQHRALDSLFETEGCKCVAGNRTPECRVSELYRKMIRLSSNERRAGQSPCQTWRHSGSGQSHRLPIFMPVHHERLLTWAFQLAAAGAGFASRNAIPTHGGRHCWHHREGQLFSDYTVIWRDRGHSRDAELGCETRCGGAPCALGCPHPATLRIAAIISWTLPPIELSCYNKSHARGDRLPDHVVHDANESHRTAKHLFKSNLAFCGRGVHLISHSKSSATSGWVGSRNPISDGNRISGTCSHPPRTMPCHTSETGTIIESGIIKFTGKQSSGSGARCRQPVPE